MTVSPALLFAEHVEAEEPEADEVDVEELEEPVAEDLPETGFDFLPYGIGGGAGKRAGIGYA